MDDMMEKCLLDFFVINGGQLEFLDADTDYLESELWPNLSREQKSTLSELLDHLDHVAEIRVAKAFFCGFCKGHISAKAQ